MQTGTTTEIGITEIKYLLLIVQVCANTENQVALNNEPARNGEGQVVLINGATVNENP